jgi:tubulin alpha
LSDIPRSLFFDSDPTPIASLQKGKLKDLLAPNQMFSGKEDGNLNRLPINFRLAASIYNRGCFTTGRKYFNAGAKDQIRKMLEECDSKPMVMMYRSLSGGTGTGVGDLFCGTFQWRRFCRRRSYYNSISNCPSNFVTK